MPPKKKAGKNLSAKKQMQEIVKRLMQISFRLDEHIYNSKLIPASDAAGFIDEIAIFKPLCGDDKPSLQVIEKLTRCMTSIINEPNYSITTTGCPSPVNSLPDDDRSQITDITPSIHTIDLTEDESDGVQVDVDVEIHRALSALSLRDDPNTQCSQSILDNINVYLPAPINRANASEETDKVLGTVSTGNLDIDKTSNSDVIVHNNAVTNGITSKTKDFNEKNEINGNKKKLVTINFGERSNRDNNNGNTKVSNRNSKINKPDDTAKIKRPKRNNKKTNDVVIKTVNNNVIITPTKNKNINVEPTLKQAFQNNKKITTKTTKPKRKPNARQNKNSVKIYNNSVIEDLSWIENIRYVREISENEYQSVMWEDNFWENCTLPSDSCEDFTLY